MKHDYPLVQWYAKRAEIVWQTGPNGEKAGRFYINGEEAWNRDYRLGEEVPSSINNPSYFLTNGRMGSCGHSSLTNFVILRLMGYEAKICGNNTHAWVEAIIDGGDFEVNFNNVYENRIPDVWG